MASSNKFTDSFGAVSFFIWCSIIGFLIVVFYYLILFVLFVAAFVGVIFLIDRFTQ